MNAPRRAAAWRRAGRIGALGLAAVAACGQAGLPLGDSAPPQGTVAYSANPAPAGALTITAAFDEPLAGAPLIQVNRAGAPPAPPAAMVGAGSEWHYVYPVEPAGDMQDLSRPLSVVVSRAVDAAGNLAPALVDESALAYAPGAEAVAASLEAVDFLKRGEPVLTSGPPGAWDAGALDLGDVLKVGDTFLLYYMAANDAGRRTAIGLAFSRDGVIWEKHPDPVIMVGEPGAWDSGLTLHPSVLWLDGQFHMWYVGQPSGGDSYSFRFGHTTSSDGIHWARAVPVLEHGPPGAWDEERIGGLDVVRNGSLFYLYYTATRLTPEFSRQIGCATSPDGETWTRCEGNPILQPAEGRAPFEGNEVEGPNVTAVYGSWLLAYTGYGGPQGANFHIGLARSADGLRWQRLSRDPVLDWGPPGSLDETGTSQPALIVEGNQLWMWYTGQRFDGTSIAVAVAILR